MGELGRALQQGGMAYHPQTLAKLMLTFDMNRSGNINFHEFVALFQFLTQVRYSFGQFDRNRNGTLDWAELGQALAMTGHPVSMATLGSLMMKFDPTRTGVLNFESYTNLSLYLAGLRTFFDMKRWEDAAHKNGQDAIKLTYEELVASAPFFG